MHIDSPTRRSLVYSWAVMHLRPPLHWWMSPNLNLHMATSIWLMQDSGTDCCGPAPRVAGWLPSLRSLWDFCLPSLCLPLPGSLRGSPCRQKEKKKWNWLSGNECEFEFGIKLMMEWRTAAIEDSARCRLVVEQLRRVQSLVRWSRVSIIFSQDMVRHPPLHRVYSCLTAAARIVWIL